MDDDQIIWPENGDCVDITEIATGKRKVRVTAKEQEFVNTCDLRKLPSAMEYRWCPRHVRALFRHFLWDMDALDEEGRKQFLLDVPDDAPPADVKQRDNVLRSLQQFTTTDQAAEQEYNPVVYRLLGRFEKEYPDLWRRRVKAAMPRHMDRLVLMMLDSTFEDLRTYLARPMDPPDMTWTFELLHNVLKNEERTLILMVEFGIVLSDHTQPGYDITDGVERARDTYETLLVDVLVPRIHVGDVCEMVVSFLTPTKRERTEELKRNGHVCV